MNIPLHVRAADVRLIGASTTGVAVLQDGASPADADLVRTGAWGESLAVRTQVDTNPQGFRKGFDAGKVSGPDLAWAVTSSTSNSISSALFRTDLLTGDTVGDGAVSGVDFTLVGPADARVWLSLPFSMSFFPFEPPGW